MQAFADHYETMQLSPHADLDTIHRVYRILAIRCHPDNLDTGDEDTFRALTDAYRILSDPDAAKELAPQVKSMLIDMMTFTTFRPALSMGRPTPSRAVLSFSKISVRG